MTTKASKVFTISSYDLNPKKQARLTTMANYFQEMAYHHAGQLGFGYDDLKEKQTYWVLSRMKIRINHYPVWDDQVKVETWHRGMERLFGLRDFRVMDQEGNLMGMASTAWLILDAQTRRPVRSNEEVMQKNKGDESVFDDGLNKILLPEQLEVLNHRRVVYSDLDIVGHVNNVKYMEWCIDAVNRDMTGHEIKELEINFTQEALLGDDIVINGALHSASDSFFLAHRKDDEKEIFRARLAWK